VKPPYSRSYSRLRLVVAYDGGNFRGFAQNLGVRTVAGTLAEALQRRLGEPVALACAGRTDAGVHATGQVVSLDVPAGAIGDLSDLQHALNRMCAPDIAVLSADWASSDFDARTSARSRTYRYSVLNRTAPDPLRRRTAWHVPEALDLTAMNQAAKSLLGEHDFASFCRRPQQRPDAPTAASTVRRVAAALWSRHNEDLLCFDITASSFCQQMVRSIVGTLIEVGQGRRSPAQIPAVIAAKDRSKAGQVAPPHGLCLLEVSYS